MKVRLIFLYHLILSESDLLIDNDKLLNKIVDESNHGYYGRLFTENDSKLKSESSLDFNYQTQPSRDTFKSSNSPLNLNHIKRSNEMMIRKSLHNFESSFREIMNESQSKLSITEKSFSRLTNLELIKNQSKISKCSN